MQSIEVEETSLKFINGLAVAKGIVHVVYPNKKTFDFECFGVINENFEEIGENRFSSNLMFLGSNKEIIRFGPTNFIVKVLCGDPEEPHLEYRHISLFQGQEILLERNIGEFQTTKVPHIVITRDNAGFRLYNILLAEYITPYFYHIEEVPDKEDSFFVTDKIEGSFFDKRGQLTYYNDFLYFYIDTKRNITSPIQSMSKQKHLENFGQISLDYYKEAVLVMHRKWLENQNTISHVHISKGKKE